MAIGVRQVAEAPGQLAERAQVAAARIENGSGGVIARMSFAKRPISTIARPYSS